MAIKFIRTPDPNNAHSITKVEMTIETNDISWPELVEEFECFLRASGYIFTGKLQMVNEDEVQSDS
jgi:hypothetical protein